MYRSFAALRMTTKRIRVILSAAKDLYESVINNIMFFVVTVHCGVFH